MKGNARKVRRLARRQGARRLRRRAPPTRSRCSSASRPSSRSTGQPARAPRSSWPRTGAPTACCAGSRRCSRSPTATSSLIITGTGDVLEPERRHRRDRLRRRATRRPRPRAARAHRRSTPRDDRQEGARRSPATSASTPTTTRSNRSRTLPMTRCARIAIDATSMTPHEIVAELDKHIVGQADAKRAVAIALRNRWRRAAGRRAAARRDHAEEHPDDRPDRRRQDRDRAPAGAGSPTRRSSRSRRPSSPRSATSAATSTRSSATWSRSRSSRRASSEMRKVRDRAPRTRPRSACSTCCCRARARRRLRRRAADADDRRRARHFRKMLREGELDDKEIEIDVAGSRPADGDHGAARHGGDDEPDPGHVPATSAAAAQAPRKMKIAEALQAADRRGSRAS